MGTLVIDRDSQKILCDLDKEGETFTVAQGGKGGRGNKHFATSRERTPHYSEKGQPFQERNLALQLKILSHVGIVGAPNAGKSTLLSKVSNAKPAIGDYEFTTLTPKIGVVDLGFNKRFTVAELPGLIEGAHLGKGMGNEFLSHVERTKVLLFLIDGSNKKQIKSMYKMLLDELGSYNEDLLNKKRLIVINKIDTWKNHRKKELTDFFKRVHEEVFFLSALKNIGISELVEKLSQIVSSVQEEETKYPEEGILITEAKGGKEPVKIKRINDKTYKIINTEIERRVALTDFRRYGSVNELLRYFDKMKLELHLKKQGVKEGDRIFIGEKSFIFKEDK